MEAVTESTCFVYSAVSFMLFLVALRKVCLDSREVGCLFALFQLPCTASGEKLYREVELVASFLTIEHVEPNYWN